MAKRSGNDSYLYETLKEDIQKKVRSGEYRPGRQIPTEAELCAMYGVSRVTVRRAINELIEMSVLEAKRGRGTYVSGESAPKRVLYAASGFMNSCRELGQVPSSRILQISLQYPKRDILKKLSMCSSDKYLQIKRCLYADNMPVIYEDISFMPRFSSLFSEDLENRSLDDLLKEKYGIRGFYCDITAEITKLRPEEASELNLREGDLAVLSEEINYDIDTHELINYSKQIVGTDSWVVHYTSTR